MASDSTNTIHIFQVPYKKKIMPCKDFANYINSIEMAG